jgi:putative DNA primase/helicase
MPQEKRKELDSVNADFEAAQRALLGAVFDAVSCSMRNKDRIMVKHPPRMADMANWVTRAEPALGWERGTYVRTFQTSVEEAASISLEASPLGQGLLQWLHRHPGGFDGYAAEFLLTLA